MDHNKKLKNKARVIKYVLQVSKRSKEFLPLLLDQFSFLGNRARYEFIELDISTGLDMSIPSSRRISLVFWATELDTSLSSSICQPASINKSNSGNRARYGFIEVDISTGLDEQINLGKPSSICRYRARIVEDDEARTFTFPGGQVECYRAR